MNTHASPREAAHGRHLQSHLLLLLCSCQFLSSQTVQQLDGAMAGSAIQGAFWHSRQAPLYCGAPTVGDPGVLIRLASRWPDAVHVRFEVGRAIWQLKLYITCSDINQALQDKTSAVLQPGTSATVHYTHLEPWACVTTTSRRVNVEFGTRPAGRLCSERAVQGLGHCNIAWYRWEHYKQ